MTSTPLPAGRAVMSIAGLCGLAAAMGLGRFVYTPLMPLMTTHAGMSHTDGAVVATANYAGYLLGAILLARLPGLTSRRSVAWWSGLLVASELLMAVTSSTMVWSALRLIAGVASAVIFIACVNSFAHHRESGVSAGVLFAGIGTGITLSGVMVIVAQDLSWQMLWLIAGVLTAALLVPMLRWVPFHAGEASYHDEHPRFGRDAQLLCASYFLEGIGYIIVGTFVVAAVQSTTHGSVTWGSGVWVAAGLAAIPATLIWHAAAARWGAARAMTAALVIQAAGATLPFFSDSVAAALVSAITFGATFTGLVLLAIAVGADLRIPQAAARLTVIYGAGQILGPLVVTPTLGSSYRTAFMVAGIAIAVSAVISGRLVMRRARIPVAGRERTDVVCR